MCKKSLFIIPFTLIFVLIAFNVKSEILRASLAQMPVHALSKTKGVQVDLVNAIAIVSGYDINIDVYPFARSVENVINGNADFHIPLIKNNLIPAEQLPFAYSTATIFHVNFVLYTKKGSEVNKENLTNYLVETDRAHIDYFSSKVTPSDSIEQSLKRLHLGMIDAYIFADTATDPLLLSLGYTDINRSLYQVYEVKIVLSKNQRGKYIDSILSKAVEKLRASGQLKEISANINFAYNNWQPDEYEVVVVSEKDK